MRFALRTELVFAEQYESTTLPEPKGLFLRVTLYQERNPLGKRNQGSLLFLFSLG